MGSKDEVKLTLQQLLSLYTGGRPVGIRDYGDQFNEFFDFYGQLSYIDEKKFSGSALKEAEQLNFDNMIKSIELQYPALKKSKEFRELYKEYVKKVPNLYDHVHNDMSLNHLEYQFLSQKLMRKAREILGSDKIFIVKNLRAFSR